MVEAGLTTMLAWLTVWAEVFSVASKVIVLAVIEVSVLKVATPPTTATVVVPPSVPKPLVIVTLTVVELLVATTLPYASCNWAVKVVIGVEELAV